MILFSSFIFLFMMQVGWTAKSCIKLDIDSKHCTNPKNCTTIQTCASNMNCHNYYHLVDGEPKLFFASCFDQNCCREDDPDCSTDSDSCVIKYYQQNKLACCCSGERCNAKVIFRKENIRPPTTKQPKNTSVLSTTKSSSTSNLIVFILTPIVFFAVIVIVIILLYKRHKKAKQRMRALQNNALSTPPIQTRPVQMHSQVSRGQFGCVWKAIYDHKLVAIKIILPDARVSWETEKKMYSDYALDHENVLKFYSAEKRLESNCLQYWIVTEFQENGSLTDYLPNILFDINSLVKILYSIVSGLTYLHQEDSSRTPIKPSIAHRDFKSRNLLVKSDGTCCVSDFGSAFTFLVGCENDEAKAQVGTNRYMAPEVLQGAVAFQPESFLCIDIYAMALVFWECISRCNASAAPVEPYRAPYEIEVGTHPSTEDMKACVCDNQYRPILKPEWRQNKKLAVICDSIEECWDDESDARLSAFCVYERLKQLVNTVDEDGSQDNHWSNMRNNDIDDNEDDTEEDDDERSHLVNNDVINESSFEEHFERPPEYSNISSDSFDSSLRRISSDTFLEHRV